MPVTLFTSHPLELSVLTRLEYVCPSFTLILPSQFYLSCSFSNRASLWIMELEFACPSVSLPSTGATGTNRAGVCVPLRYHCVAVSIPAKLFIRHHSFSLLHGIGVYMPLCFPRIHWSYHHKQGWSMCVFPILLCHPNKSLTQHQQFFTVSHWLLSL